VVPGAVMHVPDEAVEAVLDEVAHCAADALVPVGGGSAVGLAKAFALETGLPIVPELRRVGDDADLGTHVGRRRADRAGRKASVQDA
jgi:alcohol dehydrogenase class IV